MFAYGITMYHLLTGAHPFEKDLDKPSVVNERLRQSDPLPLPTGQSLIRTQSIIERCCQYWPGDRPSATQIVAELCEPVLHLQCKDISLNGNYRVLATTVVQEFDVTDAVWTEFDSFDHFMTRSNSMNSCQTSSRNKHSERRSGGFLKRFRTTVDVANRREQQNFNTVSKTGKKNQNRKRSVSTSECTLPTIEAKMATHEYENQTNYFATIATSDIDELLIGDPQSSCFFRTQKLEEKSLDSYSVTAALILNGKLWIGLSSRNLCVFDCFEKAAAATIKNKTFQCNDVVIDILFHSSTDESKAIIFAVLANGQLVVVQGHRHYEQSTILISKSQVNVWIRDFQYEWCQPRVLTLGHDNRVKPTIVVTKLNEIWYCQESTIRIVNTDDNSDHWVPVDITVPDIQTIHEPVVFESSVWCCDLVPNDLLYEIDIETRSVNAVWNLKDLHEQRKKRLQETQTIQKTDYRRKRLSFSTQFDSTSSVRSLAVVFDTLWIACSNEVIFILSKDTQQKPSVLTLLRTKSGKRFKFNKASIQSNLKGIKEMKQLEDRVLVFNEMHAGDDKGHILVAQVYQAFNSNQLKDMANYYNINDA